MRHQRGYGQALLSATAPDASRKGMDGASESQVLLSATTSAWRGTREAIARFLISASAPDARRISMDVAPERLWSGFAINHCTPEWRGTREAIARFC